MLENLEKRSKRMLSFFNSMKGIELKNFAQIAYARWLNGTIINVERGFIELEFFIRSEMANPVNLFHGGIQCGMLDNAIGMAVASTRLIKQVEEYVHKLQIIFAPLFFAIIGAQVDLRGVNIEVLSIAGIIVAVAILTKLVGCGLPSWIFLKDKTKSMRVGIGMVSRGEVGLIVAGVGASSGVLSGDIYTAIIIMVAATTVGSLGYVDVTVRFSPSKSMFS